MVSPPPYRRPHGPPDIEARVTFLPADHGGRTGPVASGYRPNHDFGLPGEINDAQHEYPGVDWVQPGQTVHALLWLLMPERQKGRLYPGFTFTVQEGPRVVGSGTIVTVVNQTLSSGHSP